MKLLTTLLVISLILSSAPIQCVMADSTISTAESGQPSRVYRITPEEYEQVKPLLEQRERQGAITIAQVASAEPIPTNTPPATHAVIQTPVDTTNSVILYSPVPRPMPPPPPPSGPPIGIGANCSCDGFDALIADIGSSNWSSGDGAIVIFVVIGVVVVLSVVVYAGAFIYQALIGPDEVEHWWDVEVNSAILFGKGSEGYMAGVRLSSGLENSEARVGLVLECGGIDNEIIHPPIYEPINVNGVYGLAGGGVRWNVGGKEKNPSFVGVELLGGTASAENVDLISAARMNLSLGLTEHSRLGFSLGALYMGLETDDGIVKAIDNFSTMVGIQAGYRF